MSPEEKRARRRERARAAYARDPEKLRKRSRENRLKSGAVERHKEYVKAWALRNAERVKTLRKEKYEEDSAGNIEKARAWKKRNPAKVLASQRARASVNLEKNRAAREAWAKKNPTKVLESFKRYRERNRAKIRARLAASKEGRESAVCSGRTGTPSSRSTDRRNSLRGLLGGCMSWTTTSRCKGAR